MKTMEWEALRDDVCFKTDLSDRAAALLKDEINSIVSLAITEDRKELIDRLEILKFANPKQETKEAFERAISLLKEK